MINIERSKTILALALPIMGGMASQSLLNLVDAAMVGTLGEAPLAAAGIGGYANFMTIAFVIGLGAGVQAMVARRVGENNWHQAALPLNSGLLISLVLATPIFLGTWLFADRIMALLTHDPAVTENATLYYRARVLGIFAVGINFCYRGYWNGINRSMVYMSTLITMHLFNVVISYALIFGRFGLPALGIEGAGLGTSIALYFGSLIYTVQTWAKGRPHGFLQALPDKQAIRTILQVALPNSFQQLFFAAGLATLFWIFGLVGTDALAVGHVLITLVLFLILPAIGLGMSATSLVGQALGRNDPHDAYRWGWDVTKLASLLLFVLAIPMWLCTDTMLGLFLHEDHLIELGRLPLKITGIAICLDGIAIVLTNSLLGAGAAQAVMRVTLSIQWLFFLPLAYWIGPVLGHGLLAIWLLQVVQRLLTTLILGTIWVRRRWTNIQL